MAMEPTFAVMTLWNSTVEGETSVGQAFKVLFRVGRPSAFESLSGHLVREVEANDILAIHLTLKVDQSVDVEGLLFLQFETLVRTICSSHTKRAYSAKAYHSDGPDLEVVLAHFLLDIDEGGLRDSLGVDVKGLSFGLASFNHRGCFSKYLAEVIKVSVIIGLLQLGPGLLRSHVSDATLVQLAVFFAILSHVACHGNS